MAQVEFRADPTHIPLTVVATLRNGALLDTQYTLDLAGVLQSRMRDITRSDSVPTPASLDEPDDYPLPLAQVVDEATATFMWAASCAERLYDSDIMEPHTFYRRRDTVWASSFSHRPIPWAVQPQVGAWRDMMMPAPATLCGALRWRCVGNPDAIRRLLSPIRYVGRRRHSGEGRVLSWDVQQAVTSSPLEHHAFVDSETGTILRPCYPIIADAAEVPYSPIWFAVRPPSWAPGRLHQLAATPGTGTW